MDDFGVWFDGVWSEAAGFLEWLTGQWWFWILVILIALGVLVAFSAFFWGMVIAVGFSSWRRALVSVPVLAFLVFLLVVNFTAVLDWVNLYWPLTAIPVLIVIGLPLMMVFSAVTSGPPGSRCATCGASDHETQFCSP